jgi:hypothetical protein
VAVNRNSTKSTQKSPPISFEPFKLENCSIFPSIMITEASQGFLVNKKFNQIPIKAGKLAARDI